MTVRSRLSTLIAARVALGTLLAATVVSLAGDTGTLVVKTTDGKGSPFPGVVVEITNAKGLSVPAPKQTDGQGSAAYKRQLVRVYVARSLAAALKPDGAN